MSAELYTCVENCGFRGTAVEMQEHYADPHFSANHESAPADERYLPPDPALFEPVPGNRLGRIRCRACGHTGYPQPLYLGAPSPFWWGLDHLTHPWPCSSCDRVFTSAVGLHNHRRASHHGKEER